ncbi:Asialoglycoprotein receptor 1 [Halocaridina rubra]|uniref:Asialoglycoprotein receptor 1 n=1 Tax=Halocaridina rubra TaxID=373956 RepID=A0AAN9A044_HALRR
MKKMRAEEVHISAATVAVLIISLVNVTKCSSSKIFMKFRDDVETSETSALFVNVSITTCGIECFKAAKFRLCLGFQWRSSVDNTSFDQANQLNSDDPLQSTLPTKSPLLASKLLGQCGLLQCVPDQSTLVSAIGSQIYLFEVPQNYSLASTYAYRIYDENFLSYANAEKQCEADGAKLMVIKSQCQEGEINPKLQPFYYWIGVTDRKKEGEWILSDGSTPSYYNWGTSQPNNVIMNDEDQDCVLFRLGEWNDYFCSTEWAFICQIMFAEVSGCCSHA